MHKVSPRFATITAGAAWYCGYDADLISKLVPVRSGHDGAYAYVPNDGLDLGASGLQAGDWGDVFFDNVFITPAVIDAGLVASEETFEFAVWHSYRTSIGLVGVGESGADDIELTGLKTGLVASFVSSQYEVFLNQNTVDVSYTAAFDFGVSATYDFKLTASRAIVASLPVDWSQLPSLRHDYLTEIIESWDGSEQRISLRDQPRLTADYQYTLSDADQYQFSNMTSNFSGQFLTPVWPWQMDIAEDVSRFDDSVVLHSISRWAVPGSMIMLSDNESWEIAEISSVVGEVVKLVSLVKKNYRSGSRIVPISPAWINGSISSQALGNMVERIGMSFDFDEVQLHQPAAVDDFTRFNNRRVLDIRPDRSRDCGISYNRLRETLDPNIGRRYVLDRIQGAAKTFSYSWRFFNEPDRQRFEDFAALERGCQGEFYFESPLIAMELVKDVQASTLDITIKKANYKNFLKSKTFAPAVAIRLYNGTVLYRNVESATDGLGDTEMLTLREPLENVQVSDVDYIAPLYLGRFDTDEFQFDFDTSTTSSITKNIKQLLYADPEIDRASTVTQ